jgi:hypothetical protein
MEVRGKGVMEHRGERKRGDGAWRRKEKEARDVEVRGKEGGEAWR